MGSLARAVVAAGLSLMLVGPALSEEGWGYQISHELMSPFCPGRTLASCPSEKADELRLWILLQESAGATREEVESQLVARYGSEILPAPAPDDAAGIAGYAVPTLAIVAGLPLVVWLLRRLTGPAASGGETGALQTAVPEGDALDPDLAAEIDRELGERES